MHIMLTVIEGRLVTDHTLPVKLVDSVTSLTLRTLTGGITDPLLSSYDHASQSPQISK